MADKVSYFICSKCKTETVSEFDNFCSNCGKPLLLPADIRELDVRRNGNEPEHNHEFMEEIFNFCPICGKKLPPNPMRPR